MSESSEVRGRNIMIAVTTAAVVIVAAVAAAVGLSGSSDDDGTVAVGPAETQTDGDGGSTTPDDQQLATGEGTTMLPEAMSGQQAIDALGDKLAVVAERNNMTAEKLRKLLLTDSTLHVTPAGSLLYVDTMTPPPSE